MPEIKSIESGLSSQEKKEVLKQLLRQTEIDLYGTLQLASICKTVDDEKGLETYKAAAVVFEKKKAALQTKLSEL